MSIAHWSRQSLLLAVLAVTALQACTKRAEAPAPVVETTAATEAEATATTADGVHAFKVGTLDALALRDGAVELPNDNKVLGVGRTPEEVGALLTAAGQPADKLQLHIQPLLVRSADRVLLFDAGAASAMGPSAGQLPASLAAAGVDPVTVTDVFISHVHGDHVAGLLNAQRQTAFPNATVHIPAPEWNYLTSLTEEGAASMGGLAVRDAFVGAVQPKLDAFKPGAELVPGVVTAVEVKGHTPGHSAYLISSGADSLLYIGDSLHHYIVSVQKPEWTIAFDTDAATAQASRAALLEQSAASSQRIYAVHFPYPGLGRFEKRPEGYVWVAE